MDNGAAAMKLRQTQARVTRRQLGNKFARREVLHCGHTKPARVLAYQLNHRDAEMRNTFKIELKMDLPSDDEEKKKAVQECVRMCAQLLLGQATMLAGRQPPSIAVLSENNMDGTEKIKLFENTMEPDDDGQ